MYLVPLKPYLSAREWFPGGSQMLGKPPVPFDLLWLSQEEFDEHVVVLQKNTKRIPKCNFSGWVKFLQKGDKNILLWQNHKNAWYAIRWLKNLVKILCKVIPLSISLLKDYQMQPWHWTKFPKWLNFYWRQKPSLSTTSVITSKSLSKNFSVHIKHFCFCCLQDKPWIKMPKWTVFVISSQVCHFDYWDFLQTIWHNNCRSILTL